MRYSCWMMDFPQCYQFTSRYVVYQRGNRTRRIIRISYNVNHYGISCEAFSEHNFHFLFVNKECSFENTIAFLQKYEKYLIQISGPKKPAIKRKNSPKKHTKVTRSKRALLIWGRIPCEYTPHTKGIHRRYLSLKCDRSTYSGFCVKSVHYKIVWGSLQLY